MGGLAEGKGQRHGGGAILLQGLKGDRRPCRHYMIMIMLFSGRQSRLPLGLCAAPRATTRAESLTITATPNYFRLFNSKKTKLRVMKEFRQRY